MILSSTDRLPHASDQVQDNASRRAQDTSQGKLGASAARSDRAGQSHFAGLLDDEAAPASTRARAFADTGLMSEAVAAPESAEPHQARSAIEQTSPAAPERNDVEREIAARSFPLFAHSSSKSAGEAGASDLKPSRAAQIFSAQNLSDGAANPAPFEAITTSLAGADPEAASADTLFSARRALGLASKPAAQDVAVRRAGDAVHVIIRASSLTPGELDHLRRSAEHMLARSGFSNAALRLVSRDRAPMQNRNG